MVSEREIEELRAHLPDVLRELCGATDLRRGFRCPLPGHEDRGPSAHYYENGHTVHCFGCGVTLDAFSLVGELRGIDSFPEQVRAVADLVGYRLADDGEPRRRAKPKPKPRPLFDKPKRAGGADCSEACGRAFGDLYAPGNEAGRVWLRLRGLDDRDASRWGLGFVRESKAIMGEFRVSEPGAAGFVTIPFWGADFKEARYCMLRTVPGVKNEVRNKEWRPAGIGSPLWREWLLWSGAPVVMVTEGLIDAMALDKMLRRGAEKSPVEVMALGGTSNARRLAQVLYQVPQKQRPRKIIVAMDEDDAGHDARDRICRDLNALGVAHELNPPWPDGAKDADEWLMAGRGVTWEYFEYEGSVEGSVPLYATRWL